MRKFIPSLALLVIFLSNNAFAMGLGEIQVNSKLNQQLEARINLLSAAPEEADSMIIRLASQEEFIKANLDRPYSLSDLKFKTLVEEDRVYITVSTAKPVREPSLSFLLELDWPKGHLIRQYTILLEPPTFRGQKAAQRAAEASSRPAMLDD